MAAPQRRFPAADFRRCNTRPFFPLCPRHRRGAPSPRRPRRSRAAAPLSLAAGLLATTAAFSAAAPAGGGRVSEPALPARTARRVGTDGARGPGLSDEHATMGAEGRSAPEGGGENTTTSAGEYYEHLEAQAGAGLPDGESSGDDVAVLERGPSFRNEGDVLVPSADGTADAGSDDAEWQDADRRGEKGTKKCAEQQRAFLERFTTQTKTAQVFYHATAEFLLRRRKIGQI